MRLVDTMVFTSDRRVLEQLSTGRLEATQYKRHETLFNGLVKDIPYTRFRH